MNTVTEYSVTVNTVTEYYQTVNTVTEYYQTLNTVTEYLQTVDTVSEYYQTVNTVTEYYQTVNIVTEYYQNVNTTTTEHYQTVNIPPQNSTAAYTALCTRIYTALCLCIADVGLFLYWCIVSIIHAIISDTQSTPPPFHRPPSLSPEQRPESFVASQLRWLSPDRNTMARQYCIVRITRL